jgi:hypothetical protein
MSTLADKLHDLEEWLSNPASPTKFLRQKLHGLTGIIEAGYNAKPNTFTAAYSVKNKEFDKILYGKKTNGGGILTIQCGFVSPPFEAVVGYPDRPESMNAFFETISREANDFFCSMGSLQRVYDELGANEPEFLFADPRATSSRHLFRAIVASVMGTDWCGELDLAFETLSPGLSRSWLEDVAKRLTAFGNT